MTYPQTPPTAHFKTKIFHPNVEPATGAICVETLKRDWKPELTLRDILITINCLLIYPNPASALNAEAGRLAEEDFSEYERKARLWAKMHASIPPALQAAVDEAKGRGDAAPGPSLEKGKGKKNRKGRMAECEDVFVREDSIKITPPRPRASTEATTMAMPPPPVMNYKGLGIDVPEGSPVLASLETPTQPPPPGRWRRKKPIQGDDTPTLASVPAIAPSMNASVATPTPQGAPLTHSNPSTPRPPEPKRRRLTPSNEPELPQYTPAKAVPEAEYPWLNWQKLSPASSPEDEMRKKRRKLSEQARLQSVGGCLQRYNSGQFGPRTGIERL